MFRVEDLSDPPSLIVLMEFEHVNEEAPGDAEQ
jgi:hypothetical protein